MRFALASALLMAAAAPSSAAAEDVISLVKRNYYAYGYKDGTTSGVPDGFAYGMGGLETISYDNIQKIVYGTSEAGAVTVIDYANGPEDAPQTDIVLTIEGTLTHTSVCPERGLLFVVSLDDPNPGHVLVYKAATRAEDGTITPPEMLKKVEVGYGPDMARPNSACTILAVANEGEGEYDDITGLTNPPGSVSLINVENLDNITVTNVPFTWTDEELAAKDVHLPLSKNALEYWNSHSSIADEVNFDNAIANYTAADGLEPEWLAWSANDEYVLVNLQENSALVKVNAATGVAEDIYSYGLKSWENSPIDIIEDDGCATMPKVPGLFSARTPDSIEVVVIGDETYILTANEGDDIEYGPFEEKLKSKDIFVGSSLGLLGATAENEIFDPASPMDGQSKYFNDDCDEEVVGWCAKSMRMAVGTSMVDYSNVTAPHIKKMVAIGGRGVSVYKFTDDGLELVWDSGSEFETEGCKNFPWAHNGIQDEEFAAVNSTRWITDPGLQETLLEMNDPEEDGCEDGGDGNPGACPLGKTVDERSLKDGYAAEAIVSGMACGKRYMVTVSEKNSVGFLYDISDISNPQLVQVFHLSPASETLNPNLAYAARTIGEIDAESIIFMEAENSPTGEAGILFAGAWSSTTSFWKFNCDKATGDDAAQMDEKPADDAMQMDEKPADDAMQMDEKPAEEPMGDNSSSAFTVTSSVLAAAAVALVALVV